jgi:hypothetical protein
MIKSYEGTRPPSKIGEPVNEEMHAPRYEPRKTRKELDAAARRPAVKPRAEA